MNIGDDYAPLDWGGRGWNDVHAQIEGPVIRDLHRLFGVAWRSSEPWSFEGAPEPHVMLQDPMPIHGSTTRAQALAVGRFFGRKLIQRHLHHAIGTARERIWIASAYFIPTRAMRGALKRAARRGVDVRILTPRNMDIPGLADASRYTWASLLKAGVKLFEWLPGMLHAKTISVDGVWSTVGSYNLDSRSLLYNWEVTLEVLDARVSGALEAKFRDDLQQSERVDPGRWRQRGWWQKLRERFFYVFRGWL
jgi:cardiolipin synthase